MQPSTTLAVPEITWPLKGRKSATVWWSYPCPPVPSVANPSRSREWTVDGADSTDVGERSTPNVQRPTSNAEVKADAARRTGIGHGARPLDSVENCALSVERCAFARTRRADACQASFPANRETTTCLINEPQKMLAAADAGELPRERGTPTRQAAFQPESRPRAEALRELQRVPGEHSPHPLRSCERMPALLSAGPFPWFSQARSR